MNIDKCVSKIIARNAYILGWMGNFYAYIFNYLIFISIIKKIIYVNFIH